MVFVRRFSCVLQQWQATATVLARVPPLPLTRIRHQQRIHCSLPASDFQGPGPTHDLSNASTKHRWCKSALAQPDDILPHTLHGCNACVQAYFGSQRGVEAALINAASRPTTATDRAQSFVKAPVARMQAALS